MRFIEGPPLNDEFIKKKLIEDIVNEQILIKDRYRKWIYGKILSYDLEKGKYKLKDDHDGLEWNLQIKDMMQFLIVNL